MAPTQSLASLSDEELVGRCRQDDHDAFATLVDRYKDRVYWLVRRMVGEADHEDLTQDVFLRVYRALPRFRGDSKLSTWIFRIARNRCLSELRRRGRRVQEVSLDQEPMERLQVLSSESVETVERRLERREVSEKVRELMEQLPSHYRTALTLFHVNHVRYEEIAEIMEIPIGTVKTYIHRGRLRLRNLIVADAGELSPLSSGGDSAS